MSATAVSTKAASMCRKDPTLSSSSATTEEEFMQVLDEMNRICGNPSSSSSSTSTGDEAAPESCSGRLSSGETESFSSSVEDEPNALDSSPLEPLFDNNKTLPAPPPPPDEGEAEGKASSLSPQQPQPNQQQQQQPQASSSSPSGRSRHCSANSSLSCVSFDSAIGDVYSVQTPPVMSSSSPSTSTTSASSTSPPSVTLTNNALEAAAFFAKNSEEDLNLNSSAFDFDPNLLDAPAVQVATPSLSASSSTSASPPHQQPSQQQLPPPPSLPPPYKSRSAGHYPPRHNPYYNPHPHHHPPPYAYGRYPQRQPPNQRHEVEFVCLDLLRRFQHSSVLHPRHTAKEWLSKNDDDDPLLITTRLLSDALTRLKFFLFGLEPMNWLHWMDRNILYSSGVCAVAILKSSAFVDPSTLPDAYPLPYGEYLDEVEAVHLIQAHDYYNELKSLAAHVQNLNGIPRGDLPITLLVIMITFFTPQPKMIQPGAVARAQAYYIHILQVYLQLRFGPTESANHLGSILEAVDRVKAFSMKMRTFMRDVINCGLQRQYESVCENIGLMAFVLQSETGGPNSH